MQYKYIVPTTKKEAMNAGIERKQDESSTSKPKKQSTSKEEEESRFTVVSLTGEETDDELDDLATRMLEALGL